jgi:hypothetical protein
MPEVTVLEVIESSSGHEPLLALSGECLNNCT